MCHDALFRMEENLMEGTCGSNNDGLEPIDGRSSQILYNEDF